MSDPTPLDAAELVRRARSHAGAEPADDGAKAAPTLGAGAEKLLVDASSYHPAWRLPPGARLQGLRRAFAMPLAVYTDRQNQLNADLLGAFASLLLDCQALEARVAQLEADVARLSSSEETGSGRP